MIIESVVITTLIVFARAGAVAQQSPAQVQDISTLTHTAVIPAPVGEVWDAFTTKEGVESWMVPQAEIDLRVGGAMRTHYDPNGTIGDANTIENTYLAIVPQRLLAFRCTKAPESVWFKDLIGATWSIITFEEASSSATRLTLVGVGYTDDPDSQRMREFFQSGNQQVMDALAARFTDTSSASDNERILELLHGLVGEWEVFNERENGAVFRARSVYELGPDGVSMLGRGWLGDAESLHPHGATHVWRAPGPGKGGIEFQSIDENGAIARGPITLEGDNTLIWQWDMTRLDGAEDHYIAHMTIETNDSYRFIVHHRNEDGGEDEFVNVVFERER